MSLWILQTVIRFDKNGNFDADKTRQAFGVSVSQKCEKAVIPGFYGGMEDGTVKTFSTWRI